MNMMSLSSVATLSVKRKDTWHIVDIVLSLSYDFSATCIDPASNSVDCTGCNVLRYKYSEI